jgi:hypothetical protein
MNSVKMRHIACVRLLMSFDVRVSVVGQSECSARHVAIDKPIMTTIHTTPAAI